MLVHVELLDLTPSEDDACPFPSWGARIDSEHDEVRGDGADVSAFERLAFFLLALERHGKWERRPERGAEIAQHDGVSVRFGKKTAQHEQRDRQRRHLPRSR
jgi:hypothetical protein